ncbi:YbaK/EbsC family protein [Candidatus Nomurabacteria bacterium]|uniref:YbaK/EbsC family protein n=1 Tax=Candidatus Dojkabacteria bacterium TaxID=2099670 RepID=A0A955I5E8_9BACT|nr:YbaK/EbsC family protein [Candidatus Dojkabacteria bacterium]MCB9789879.1 YbaK/EbsC family protein [Candidatus Nomurabacteria bacterium]MCB9803497.1 YbaK/EbsC family protein [Candidatus Nomurabacteria bacterium]
MSVQQFKQYVSDNKLEGIDIVELDQETRTAESAAKANGVHVSSIVKSLLVAYGEPLEFCICLVPGDRRLDLERLTKFLGQNCRMATPDEVKSLTGYSIGGVPPLGHVTKVVTYILSGFSRDADVIAAAGSGNSVFRVPYSRLVEITGAIELDI